MTIEVGIILALVAMVSWGFGDFLIQKSTRKVGDWETLFIISLFGFIVLIPFVWHSLPLFLFSGGSFALMVIIAGAIVLLLAALLEFESLRVGKIAVVEPCWSIEIPAAAFLAFVVLREQISSTQIVVVIILMISLILVGLRSKVTKAVLLEKGTLLAISAGLVMGGATFLMSWSGRLSDPLLVNFLVNGFLMMCSGMFLYKESRLKNTIADLRHSYKLLLSMSFLDNVAWIAFIFSTSLAPIAISTALSESYIIIAILMGLFIGRERLKTHQKIGLVGAIISAIVLAVISST